MGEPQRYFDCVDSFYTSLLRFFELRLRVTSRAQPEMPDIMTRGQSWTGQDVFPHTQHGATSPASCTSSPTPPHTSSTRRAVRCGASRCVGASRRSEASPEYPGGRCATSVRWRSGGPSQRYAACGAPSPTLAGHCTVCRN